MVVAMVMAIHLVLHMGPRYPGEAFVEEYSVRSQYLGLA
jgi:hypothetical protein